MMKMMKLRANGFRIRTKNWDTLGRYLHKKKSSNSPKNV
jgi:hypothetical protein